MLKSKTIIVFIYILCLDKCYTSSNLKQIKLLFLEGFKFFLVFHVILRSVAFTLDVESGPQTDGITTRFNTFLYPHEMGTCMRSAYVLHKDKLNLDPSTF